METTTESSEALKIVADLVDELRCRKEAIRAADAELDALKKSYAEVEARVLATLDAANLDRFHGERCTVQVRVKSSWRVPKEPAEREVFFSYLRERGVFDDLITVHSQTLNSWANAEQEAQAAKGQYQFTIPGLAEPTEYKQLTVRIKE